MGLFICSLPFLQYNDSNDTANGFQTGSGLIKHLIKQEQEKEKRERDSDTESQDSRDNKSYNSKKKLSRRGSRAELLSGSANLMESVSSMGSSVKGGALSDEGLMVTSDLSNLTVKESLAEAHFWQIIIMITLSLTFAFFMKVCFKSYGSTFHSDDLYLT